MAFTSTTKKSARKTNKATASRVARKSIRTAVSKTNKAAAKKAPTNKTKTKAKKAVKASTKRKATAKKATKNTAAATDSVELSVADFKVVDELLDEIAPEPPTPTAKSKRSNNPRTPSVPRTVKPAPKVADLEIDEQILSFIDAIDKYKQEYSRPFPSWREVFYVFKKLGYRQT